MRFLDKLNTPKVFTPERPRKPAFFEVLAACPKMLTRNTFLIRNIAYLKKLSKHNRLAPTLMLISIVLFATWMGDANGGYRVGRWALATILLGILALINSDRGALSGMRSWSSTAALGLIA